MNAVVSIHAGVAQGGAGAGSAGVNGISPANAGPGMGGFK